MEQQTMIIFLIIVIICSCCSLSIGAGGYFYFTQSPATSTTPTPPETSITPTPPATSTTPATPASSTSTTPIIPASTQVSTPAPAPAPAPAPSGGICIMGMGDCKGVNPTPSSDCNQIPLYRMHNGSFDHMDSLSNNEGAPTYALDFQIATICSNKAKETTGLYRGYKSNGQHMSTTTLSELTNNGFTPENNSQPIGYVYTKPISSNSPPIYRLYNSSNSDHMTSANSKEASPAYIADWNGTPMFYSAK